MLLVHDKAVAAGSPELADLLQRYGAQPMARGYLESVVAARSEHRYGSADLLRLQLAMVTKLPEAARQVNARVTFGGDIKLDPAHWERVGQTSAFRCKSENYAAAVEAALRDKSKNELECWRITELMALVALLTVVRSARFDALLRARLRPRRERLTLPLNDTLIKRERLLYRKPADSYDGDAVFRPGDLIGVVNKMTEARGTGWAVENGICVAWKLGADRRARFDEPVFVGGGIEQACGSKRGQVKLQTEAELKEEVWKQVAVYGPWVKRFKMLCKVVQGEQAREACEDDAVQRAACATERYRIPESLRRHFARKALDVRPAPAGAAARRPGKGFPPIALEPEAWRLVVLGGRQDL